MTSRIVLARQCSLPTAALSAMQDPSLVDDARRLLQARADLERLRPGAEDTLHELVGGCDDTALRRELLGARRNVHKDVVAARHGELLDDLAERHPAIGQWLLAARSAERLSASDSAARARLADGCGQVIQHLSDPEIQRGIAFASTAFARELIAGPVGGQDADSRLSRSAVSYAVRAALKPSPFSSLTTLHVVAPGSQPADPSLVSPQPDWCRDYTTFRPLAVELHRQLVQGDFAWVGPMPVQTRATRTMRLRGTPYAFLPHYAHHGSLYYRTDELTELSAEAPPVNQAIGVATGRLHARRPWSLTDGHELTALFDDSRRREWPREIVSALGVVAHSERRVREASRPEALVEAIETLQHDASDALTAVGSRAGTWLLREPLIHEAVSGASVAPPARLPSSVGAVLSRRVLARSFYETLRRVFTAVHGSGSAPLIDFCAEATIALERAAVRPVDRVSLEGLPHGHLSLARPASLVYFQTSDERVVVNSVMADYLGSRSRWGRLRSLRDGLVADALATAAERHSGTVAYQFSASTDWTTTQRPGPGLPLAEWGGALLDHAGAVDLARFRVHLDSETGTLQLTDPDGAPASLLYGGAIPPHLLKGVEGVLTVLASPWAVVPPTPAPHDVEGGRFAPRLERDGVAWSRRTWTLAPEVVPTWTRGAHVTEFLAQVEQLRQRYDMPDELFVATARAVSATGAALGLGKPTWLSLDHPLSVLQALRSTSADRWVFTEALPSASSSPRVVEYMAVVDHG